MEAALLGRIGRTPPREEIVAGLIAAGEIVLLAGPPKCGKSTLAAHLAACISTGNPFLGRKVAGGAVVYVAAEKKNAAVRRLRAAGACDELVGLVSGSVTLADGATEVVETIFDLSTAGRWETSCDRAEDFVLVRAIVVDTLHAVSGGADENSASGMHAVLEAVKRLARAFPDAAVILIHHTGKTGDGARGTNAILAAADVELGVGTEARGSGRFLEVRSANEIAAGARLPFNIGTVRLEGSEVTVVEQVGRAPSEAARRQPLAGHNARRAAEALAHARSQAAPILNLGRPFTASEAAAVLSGTLGVASQSEPVRVARILKTLEGAGDIAFVQGVFRPVKTVGNRLENTLTPASGKHTDVGEKQTQNTHADGNNTPQERQRNRTITPHTPPPSGGAGGVFGGVHG